MAIIQDTLSVHQNSNIYKYILLFKSASFSKYTLQLLLLAINIYFLGNIGL